VAVQRASEAICRDVAESDAGSQSPRYGVVKDTVWADSLRRGSVTKLLRQVYGREVTAIEVDEGLTLLDDAQSSSGDWVESWAALCSTHLSGPA
jgi:hypothetical protein